MTHKLPSDEALVALYKEALNHDAPSLELDNAILAAAHKAVDAKPLAINQKRSFTRRWQLPMSIAATVVISASLVLLTPRENPALMPPTMHAAPEAPPWRGQLHPKLHRSPMMFGNGNCCNHRRGKFVGACVTGACVTGACVLREAAPYHHRAFK